MFDYDAIKAAHRTASRVLDPKGQKMDVKYDTFIFSRGTAPAFRAQEILGAIRAGGKSSLPKSADNDAAGVPAFATIELPYITTNTDYWWGMDTSMKSAEYGLQYKESQGIQLEGPRQTLGQLVKKLGQSLLINGKNLSEAILNKPIVKTIMQLQRLSEETVKFYRSDSLTSMAT